MRNFKFNVERAQNPFASGPGAELIWIIMFPSLLGTSFITGLMFWEMKRVGLVIFFFIPLLIVAKKLFGYRIRISFRNADEG